MSELYSISIKREHDKSQWFLGIWEKDGEFIRDVSDKDFEYKLEPNDDICQGIIKSHRYICCDKDKVYSKYELFARKLNLPRGYYYPKIFKPVFTGCTTEFDILDLESQEKYKDQINNHRSYKEFYFEQPIDQNHLFRSLDQLSALVDMMKNIFRTVYPSIENANTYGFEIRNLIILACTEFEDQIKGILEANNIPSFSQYYTTKDYVRLKSALRLNQYVVSFRYFPELSEVYPFENWELENPTKSLSWYNSYNLIKHDRTNNFKEGTLKVLIDSISACFIILLAQYGEIKEIKEISSSFWTIMQKPDLLVMDSEYYTVPFKRNKWIKKNFKLD